MKIKTTLLALAGSATLLAQSNLKTTQGCTGTVFSTGVNAFGTGGNVDTHRQGCLTYNKDLNALLWVHRASSVWGFPGFTNGAVQADWLNLATNQWDSTIIFTNPAADSGARFPAGVFYNPIGNTSISNAYAVSVGPTTGSTDFNGTYVAKRKLAGNYYAVTSAQADSVIYPLGAQPFGRVNGNNGSLFLNADLQQIGNTLFVGGGLVDNLQISTYDVSNHSYGGTIAHAGSNFVWSIDTIVPGFYKGGNGYTTDGEPVRLAFAPDGQTGYAFFLGRLATNFGNGADSTLSPIVYKTTNGGATWSSSPILPGYDWAAQHPEVLRTAGQPKGAPIARQFTLSDKHGIDLVVDSTGALHIVGAVSQPFMGSPASFDSLSFSYLFPWDYKTHHAVIWDFMTDGTQWKTLLVDSIMTGELGFFNSFGFAPFDSTGLYNPFNQSSIQLAYGSRIQVSRSVSGGKIFYSWTDSDSSQTHQPYNVAPNIHIKSYDISNQKTTGTINATAGVNKCYFHFLSEVSYFDNAQQAWVMPMVYTTDRNNISPPYNPAGAVNYNYINCATFSAAQYTNPVQVAGIKQIANNSHVLVYPNPAQNSFTIEVLNDNRQTFALYDITGKQILAQTITGTTTVDANNLENGIYFIQLKNNTGISTQKIIVQH